MPRPETSATTDIAAALAACRIIDLSVPLDTRIACAWPAHMSYQHSTYNWFAETNAAGAVTSDRLGAYYTATLVMDEHTGTHIDAPAHHIAPPDSGLPGAGPAGAITADLVDLERLIGRARVIDATSLVGTTAEGISPRVDIALLEMHEAAHGPIIEGDIVLIRSDWDARLGREADFDAYAAAPLAGRAPGWPAPSEAFVEALLQRGVRTVGTDGPSMGACDEGVGAHRVGLGHGMTFIEGMAALRELPPASAAVIFLGLKIVGGSGAPGRGIGLVPNPA